MRMLKRYVHTVYLYDNTGHPEVYKVGQSFKVPFVDGSSQTYPITVLNVDFKAGTYEVCVEIPGAERDICVTAGKCSNIQVMYGCGWVYL